MRSLGRFRCCEHYKTRRHTPTAAAVSLAILGVLAAMGLRSEWATAQVVDQHTADSVTPDDGADLRTTAYRNCHKDSTEGLYREHPTCQPGMMPLRSSSAAEACPYSGGARTAEIMRRSADCMRAKGY